MPAVTTTINPTHNNDSSAIIAVPIVLIVAFTVIILISVVLLVVLLVLKRGPGKSSNTESALQDHSYSNGKSEIQLIAQNNTNVYQNNSHLYHIVPATSTKKRMLNNLKRLSPFRLIGRYSLTRSVEELHQDKPLEHFRMLSTSEFTLQRCQSLPSIAMSDAVSMTKSCISRSQTESLIDQISCCQYLVPTLQRPSTHGSSSMEEGPSRSSSSGAEELEESIKSGYSIVKVRDTNSIN